MSKDTASAQVYGGPAVASVEGTLAASPSRARFRLTDACEIQRWRRYRALLRPAP